MGDDQEIADGRIFGFREVLVAPVNQALHRFAYVAAGIHAVALEDGRHHLLVTQGLSFVIEKKGLERPVGGLLREIRESKNHLGLHAVEILQLIEKQVVWVCNFHDSWWSLALEERLRTLDEYFGAGDMGGGIGSEEPDELRNLLGRTRFSSGQRNVPLGELHRQMKVLDRAA